MSKHVLSTTPFYSFIQRANRYFLNVTKPFAVIEEKPIFRRLYLVVSLIVLFASVVYWSWLSASLQQSNADQLVNPYLFENNATFKNALLPATHTFLLKWPLFMMIHLFGFSAATYIFFTIFCVLITVTGLVIGLAIIERRPVVLGTICLGLASVLLLIPAQPHTGALLPVNMAMITTRNIEYILFAGSLTLLSWRPSFKSWAFWLGIAGLALLISSDKLFLGMTLGGAFIALVAYALSNGWNLVSLSVKLLVGGALATAAASLILSLINTHLTHIVSQSQIAPYQIVNNVHELALGVCYMITGLLTNLGANPAFSTTIFKDMPAEALHNIFSLGGLAFIFNFLILVAGIYSMWWWLRRSFQHNKNKVSEFGPTNRLVIVLIWSAIAAVGLFVITSHYYAADARYLTIWLFAVFVALTAYIRQHEIRPEYSIFIGIVLCIGILLAAPIVQTTHDTAQSVQAPFTERNAKVSQALAQHHVDVLVGDYWRVIPNKFNSGGHQNVLPLGGCTSPRDTLSSKSWEPDLNDHSFAYLLTLESSQTDFPACNLDQVVQHYGRPNASVVLSGSSSNPREMLLFYDHGVFKSAPTTKQPSQGPATVVPINLDETPYTTCAVPTIVQIVAHQDDDLLFMNPDLLHDIREGHCVRSVYVTAGDAGAGSFHWLGRERGIENAYSTMLGTDLAWIERVVKLPSGQLVTIANPKGISRISLIFMYLPDGNLQGQGFEASHFQSLAHLESGAIPKIDTIYNDSHYTSGQLIDSLDSLLHLYQPSEIRTQASYVGGRYPDHSDHIAVGQYVKKAYQKYEQEQYENQVTVPLQFYIGYPIHQFPTNLSVEDLAAKQAAFFAYSKYDRGVCSNPLACINDPAYGAYLPRQYQNPN